EDAARLLLGLDDDLRCPHPLRPRPEEIRVLLQPRVDLGVGDGDARVDLPGKKAFEEELATQPVAELGVAEPLRAKQILLRLAGVVGAQAEERPFDLGLGDTDPPAQCRLLEELAVDELVEEPPPPLVFPGGIVEGVAGDRRPGGEGALELLDADRLAFDHGDGFLLLADLGLLAGVKKESRPEGGDHHAGAGLHGAASPSRGLTPSGRAVRAAFRWTASERCRGRRSPPAACPPPAFPGRPRRSAGWPDPRAAGRIPRRPGSSSPAAGGSRSGREPARRYARRPPADRGA